MVPKDYKFTTWDEFPIWAFNSKLIHIQNNFWGSDDANPYKAYQPGAQLSHYVFTSIFGWSEANVLIGQNLWILVCLIAISGVIAKKNRIAAFILLISLPTLFYSAGFSFANIMADGLLSLQFLTVMSFMFCLGFRIELIPLYIFSIVPLVLFKSIGIILVIPITVLLLNLCLQNPISSKFKIKRIYRKEILAISSFLIFSLLTYYSWTVYLAVNGIQATMVPPRYDWLLKPEFYEFRVAVFNSIIDQLLVKINDYSGIQVLGIVGTANLLIVFLSFISLEIIGRFIFRRNQDLFIFFQPLPWIVGFISYLMGLYLAYILVSTERDALQSSSFFRYISVYLFAWTASIVLRLTCFTLTTSKNNRYFFSILTLLVSFILMPASLANDIKEIRSDTVLLEKRNKFESFLNQYPLPEPGSSVYFINQNSTGFEKYVFAYLLPRNPVNYWCWSLGKKFYSEDLWTCDTTLSKTLPGYEYLFIYESGPELVADNPDLLTKYARNGEISPGLFKIRVLNGELNLDRIQSRR
jgi:hypothetical protein